jgi:ABC-2 type transport system ATP-binding protein
MNSSAAIVVELLSKSYSAPRAVRDLVTNPLRAPQAVRALEAVSLEVQRGEIFGLLGPNGAGKTTLLKLLACLVLPSSGRASVNGHSILGQERRVKSSIGYMTSDERSFYWRLSGRENLRFFAHLYGLTGERLERRCTELLEKVELDAEQAGERFMNYSSGMRQRLALARALLHDPPTLFMDEPTRSLDPLTSRHLRSFIREVLVRDEGKTVLLCTHNLSEAEELCQRVGILVRGSMRRVGTPEELRRWAGGGSIYRLEVKDVSTEALTGMHAERGTDGALHVEVSERTSGDLDTVLRRIHAAGGRLISCERIEASLEEVFDRICAAAEQDREGAERSG